MTLPCLSALTINMYIPCDKSAKRDWKGFILIVPCISVGNVGQLAVDLIISTLCLNRIGYLYDDSIVPVIGNDPFATEDTRKVCHLMTAAEVFESVQHKVVIVQLRSSIVPSKRQQFLSRLMSWIISSHFSSTVMLTSSFAHERRDTQLEGTQLRYVASSHFAKTEASHVINNTLKWSKLEERCEQPVCRITDNGDDSVHNDDISETAAEKAAKEECSKLYIPGGGFAKSLLQKCITNQVPAVILLRFCAEGDNINDALELVTMLNSWLCWLDLEKLSEQSDRQNSCGWKIPSSWRLQYGSGFQQMLFQ